MTSSYRVVAVLTLAAGALVSVVVASALLPAPVAEVTLDDAVADIQSSMSQAPSQVESAASLQRTTAADASVGVNARRNLEAPSEIEGRWSLVAGANSFVGVRIQERLVTIGAAVAVARTSEIDGRLTIEGSTLVHAEITVQMGTLATDEHHRDSHMHSALDVAEHPEAGFRLTAPIDLGDAAAGGRPISAVARGDLTIHGVTKEVSVPLETQLVGEVIVVVGSLPIAFSDYGVVAPTSAVALSVDDVGEVELSLIFSRAGLPK